MRQRWIGPALALGGLLVIGCGTPDVAPPEVQPAGSGMPRIERRPFVVAEQDRPDRYYIVFDVTASGQVVFWDQVRESGNIAVLDSTGQMVRRFGRTGEGPGETREVWHLNIQGDTLRIYGMGLIKRSLDGRLFSDERFFSPDLALSWLKDSVDQWEPDWRRNEQYDSVAIRRAIHGQPGGRRLVGMEDSVFANAVLSAPLTPMGLPYVSTQDKFWVGNGWTYLLRAYDADGKPLYTMQPDLLPNGRGPREMRILREQLLNRPKFVRGPNGEAVPVASAAPRLDTLDREVPPHFSRNPFHIDEFGRLWVVGLARDSTSVDVWADSVFLGRTMLPCFAARPGTRAALGPGWLLLECEVDDSDWPTELQLYRVIER